jgi:hypothetical protein
VNELKARAVVAAIAERMEQVGLRLHPDKTKIVYCMEGKRRGSYEHTSFTFLGFTFRQRRVRDKNGKQFSSIVRRCGHGDCIFAPAIPSPNSRGRSIRSCAGGCSTMVRSTAPRFISSYRASTPIWCAGSARSTSGCRPGKRPWSAGGESPKGTPACSRTGHGLPRSRASGDQDDKSRISREAYVRNLWEPGAAMPPATRPVMCPPARE